MSAFKLRISANFDRNLESLKAFLEVNEAEAAFSLLLDALFDRLIPNLEAHPRLGRDFLQRSSGSLEVQMRQRRLGKLLAGAELREYILDDYLVLYRLADSDLILLAIKHHRQLSFDLPRFWR